MKIYTYSFPERSNIINSLGNKNLFKIPQLCASQTLVEGTKKLIKNEFNFIDTVDTFLKEAYKNWLNNPQNDILQYNTISKEIEKIKNKSLQSAMKFNQREIMESIRFLVELDIGPNSFEEDNLSKEQRKFLEIYRNLVDKDMWQLQFEDKSVKKIMEDILERDNKKYRNINNEIDEILFHGIHRFSPIIMRLIDDLKNKDIEVNFLINYYEKYDKVFSTWKQVYNWTDCKFIKKSKQEVSEGSNLGESIGNLVQGNGKFKVENINLKKFDSLTSFADYIVEIFDDAKYDLVKEKIVKGKSVIARMSEQFYAPDNEKINDLLKSYYPDQFGERHFLSYPIGQFIIGLYNMWDESAKKIKINDNSLKECLNVNFFKKEEFPTPLEIFEKLKLYLEDLKDINSIINRLNKLKKTRFDLNKNNLDIINSKDLELFSFYTLKTREIDYFIDVIKSIKTIIEKLFGNHDEGYVNYKEHYKKLSEILTERNNGNNVEEDQLIFEVKNKLENIDQLEIKGSIEDLKETLHFYLDQRGQDDSANWIVRNFEQIDGGVMIGNKSRFKNRKFHFCLLSDHYMKKSVKDLLNWPLDQKFFESYKNNDKKINRNLNAVLSSLKEYSNFLRYSLFYATYYLYKDNIKINLSFVAKENDEERKPYFLLKILGSKIKCVKVDRNNNLNNLYYKNSYERKDVYVNKQDLSKVDYQNYSICPHRFFIEKVLTEKSSYQNEYLVALAYRNLLFKFSWYNLKDNNQLNNKDEIRKIVKTSNEKLQEYFPFFEKNQLIDFREKVIEYLEEEKAELEYLNLRLNFIYGRITDSWRSNENLIKEVYKFKGNEGKVSKNKMETRKKISKYIKENEVIKVSNKEICEFCRQRELCLNEYSLGGG